MTQDQVLTRVKLVWIQNFLFPQVARPKFKNQVYGTIFFIVGGEHRFLLFQGYQHKGKCKWACPGFELRLLIPFPSTITITQGTLFIECNKFVMEYHHYGVVTAWIPLTLSLAIHPCQFSRWHPLSAQKQVQVHSVSLFTFQLEKFTKQEHQEFQNKPFDRALNLKKKNFLALIDSWPDF